MALVVVAFILVLAKPTDQECIEQTRTHTGYGALLGQVAVNRLTVTVQDHIIYKTINSNIDGQCIGYAACGVVWCN
jgi:hypothetical protein